MAPSTIDFPGVVALLSQVHDAEVESLRSRINQLESEASVRPCSCDKVNVCDEACLDPIMFESSEDAAVVMLTTVEEKPALAPCDEASCEKLALASVDEASREKLALASVNVTSGVESNADEATLHQTPRHSRQTPRLSRRTPRPSTPCHEEYASASKTDDSSELELANAVLDPPLVSETAVQQSSCGGDSDMHNPTNQQIPAVALWPIWDDSVTDVKSKCSWVFSPAAQSTSSLKNSTSNLRAGDEVRGGGYSHLIVVRPSSYRRIVWDILSGFTLGYHVMVLPLDPFDIPETDIMKFIEIAIMLFWTLDVYFSFTTGFHHMGIVEMRLAFIARRYFRTWFVVDCALLLIDYYLLFSEGAQLDIMGIARSGKALRVLRILRMARLFRVLKAVAVYGHLNDVIVSEYIATLFGILKLVIGIIVVNHFLACGWYAVGTQTLEADTYTWVNRLKLENPGRSFPWLYTTALHWSITQFTPASMEVVPCNVLERSYALCVILLALVAFSSFISSITSSMTHLRSINQEKAKTRENVRRFITQHRLSQDLTNRIQAFMRQNPAEQPKKHLHENDVQVLGSLPDALRMEMHGEIFLPVLDPHHFFDYLHREHTGGLLRVCHGAMIEQAWSHGQMVFATGGLCTSMFFVLSGQLEYLHPTSTVQYQTGDYFSEMCLWFVEWKHRGQLNATANCEFALLSAQLFQTSLLKTTAFEPCRRYAQIYYETIREQWRNQHPISDIFFVTPAMAMRVCDEQMESKNSLQNKEHGFKSLISQFKKKGRTLSNLTEIRARHSQLQS